MDMKLPFSTTGMMLHIDDSMDYEVLSSSIESMPKSDKTEDEIVLEAMAHPIGSPKLSELAKIMNVYPQVLINAKVKTENKEKYTSDSEIMAEIKKIEDEFSGEGRVLIRPSGTEPLVRVMIEGKDQKVMNERARELADLIEKKLG